MCSRKLQENPSNKRALVLRASALLKRGDFDRAAVDYTALVEADKDDATALYNRGCAYEKSGRLSECFSLSLQCINVT